MASTGRISVPRGPVTADLEFYKPPEDGSAPTRIALGSGRKKENFTSQSQSITISDLRGIESMFSLDSNAFQILQDIKSDETDFADQEHIKRIYFPEVEKLILDHVPGAHRVHIFEHQIRQSPDAAVPEGNGPITRVHIDQTANHAAALIRFLLPAEADKLLQGRYRIINVWRSINGPVFDYPLAFANGATVHHEEDLVLIKHINPDGKPVEGAPGGWALLRYNPKQEWHYLSGITKDERLILKICDSDQPKLQIAGYTPHSAFKDPRTPAGSPKRKSIEVRALVFG